MFGRKRKPKKTLLERSIDLKYDAWHHQHKFKDHQFVVRIFKHPSKQTDMVVVAYNNDKFKVYPFVGQIFKHPSMQTDIVVVAYKNDKTWWYRDTDKRDLFVDTTIKERRAKWKLKWLEKKGLELDTPREFGWDGMKR